MKPKQLAILFAVLVGLLAVVKVSEIVRGSEGKQQVRTFVKIKAAQVDAFEIAQTSTVTRIENNGGNWEVAEPVIYPANALNVEASLDRLEEVLSDNIVSSNPDQQATFQVDNQSGTKVTLFDGSATLATFYVGKLAADGNHTYMRKEDSTDIHSVRGNLQTYFNRRLKDWRDVTIVKLDLTQVASLEVERSGEIPYRLIASADGTWTLEGDATTLDAGKTANLASYFATLTASDFVDDTASLVLDPAAPSLKVKAVLRSGEEAQVFFWVQDSVNYARRPDAQQVFKVSASVYDTLNQSAEALKPVVTTSAP